MNLTVVAAIASAVITFFMVPFLASRIVRDRGDGWVAMFFPSREPRWPDGLQEQDVPWRWHGTEPRVDPPAPRLASRQANRDALIDPVAVERVHPRTNTH